MSKPTRKSDDDKPGKPRPDFPLFPHARGYWARKVLGRLHYFGKVDDDPKGEAALEKWLDERDDLLAGRTPRTGQNGLTIADLCNRFLNNRREKLNSGKLSAVSFADYHATCERIIGAFGSRRLVADLDASDFERFRARMAKGWSPVTLGNEIQRVRVVFRYATENTLVPNAIPYGSSFKKPSRTMIRQARAAKPLRMFEAADLRRLIDAAEQPLSAMILLAINCGYGNHDITNLPIKALNLKTGWADFPRPKTAIPRRCPLWKETIASVRKAIADRPKPKDATHAGLVFITKYGKPWGTRTVREPDETHKKLRKNADDPVCKEFAKLLKTLKLYQRGLGFYAIRHTLATIGGDTRDQVAVDAIMGHARDDVASVYRERIDDARLLAVVSHVREWLFGKE
jgi:integrase